MRNILENLYHAQKRLCNIPEPIDPDEVPGDGGGATLPPTYVPGLLGYSVNRYATNVAVTEEMKVVDFINDVLFPASRMFQTQGANGKLRVRNKKPASWALATGALAASAGVVEADDVRAWINDPGNLLLVDPYTTASEIHEIGAVAYSTAQNSVTLTASANITVAGFAGASGSTPATATATVTGTASGTPSNLTLSGVAFAFTATPADTTDGIAAFLAVAINAHPRTARRFAASAAGSVVTIKGKFGTLTLTGALLSNHSAPVSDPTAAPTGTATAGGALTAGDYKFAYSFVNHRGQTLLSPVATVTVADTEKIAVASVTPPTGCTVNWYVQTAAGSERLRLFLNNSGAAFEINSLPLLTATLPPDFNRTGAEVMRVCASFSDRTYARSKRSGANILRASYEWLLGNRTKSVNRVDLKYRDAAQDYRLIELRISDIANIAKIKKTSNLEVNGQAIDNTFQAMRVGTGILAEYRDADFYYQWKASREALLLELGDVVAITDAGSGVVNLPVIIEAIAYDLSKASMPRAAFTGRKYSSSLYDDSIADRRIPIVRE